MDKGCHSGSGPHCDRSSPGKLRLWKKDRKSTGLGIAGSDEDLSRAYANTYGGTTEGEQRCRCRQRECDHGK